MFFFCIDDLCINAFRFVCSLFPQTLASAHSQSPRARAPSRTTTRWSINRGNNRNKQKKRMIKFIKLQPYPLYFQLYEKFITDFEHRINALSLVEICLPIVRQFQGRFRFFFLLSDCLGGKNKRFIILLFLDGPAAINFLTKLKEKVKHEPEAQILINTAIGAIHLEAKNLDQAKVDNNCLYNLTNELYENK